jgi:hypothetical protein
MSWARTTDRPSRAKGWLAILAWLAGAAPALAAPGRGRCAATITGSFADSCRDFAAHSSKDISYVELHYVDGRVVKHRNINRRDWAVDGGPDDAIDFARVKSGTTIQEFACEATNTAPTALVEIQTPAVDQTVENCQGWTDGLICQQASPRTDWTGRAQIPDIGGAPGLFLWGCGGVTPPSQCGWTITFRGTGSVDADGDIASWSIDFGDGTSMNGAWTTPPAEVAHEYLHSPSGAVCGAQSSMCVVTLTVTDAAGQSASETIRMVFLDQSPD